MKISRAFLLTLITSFFIISSTTFASAQQQKLNAYLVPVGGGLINDTLLLKIVNLSTKKNPKILVIPYASRLEDVPKAIQSSTEMFKRIGINNITVLDVYNSDKSAALIKSSDVIWMSGGGQLRLRKVLEKADLADDILNRYVSGNIVISGTSAGASVMNDIMISTTIRDKEKGTISPEMSYGLKLWPTSIIDQHFTQRNRLERLKIAVEMNKNLLGIGLDEGTCVIFSGDGKINVWGKGTVTFVKSNNDQKMTETVLIIGDSYTSQH